MSTAEVCASCGFGPGERTGRLCRYDVPDGPAFGDWRGRRGVLLCDDCVRQAPGVLHPVVEAPEEPPERILAGLTEHATMVRAATDDCTPAHVVATYPPGAGRLHYARVGEGHTLCGVALRHGRIATGTGVTHNGERAEATCLRCLRSAAALEPEVRR